MTLGTTTPPIEYVENGATLTHPIPFEFADASEIACTRILSGIPAILVQGADYTVSGGGSATSYATGTVTKTNGGVSGQIFRIERKTPRSQPTDYTPGDAFPAETHEHALDRGVAMVQEVDVDLADLGGRALRVPAGETMAILPAASSATRKGTILGFNLATGLRELLSYVGLAALIIPGLQALGFAKGDPGGTAMAIGPFAIAGTLNIPVGTDLVKTSGYTVTGTGSAEYIYDAAVDAAYVAAKPRASFRSLNGRGFRLAPQFFSLTMFGAVPDDSGVIGGANGTDTLPAFNAAKAYLAAVGIAGPNSYNAGLPILNIEPGYFYSSAEWDVDVGQMQLLGQGSGRAGSAVTQIRFPLNKGGLRTQRADTSGLSGVGGTGKDAWGSIIHGFKLLGAYAGVEGEYHGVQIRTNARISDVWAEKFQGDGFYFAADSAGGGGVPRGNINLSILRDCTAQFCRKGLYITGGDSNACVTLSLNLVGNRLRGLDDNCFINNAHYAPHAATNGFDPRCGANSGGRYYAVIRGQETWASTNAPTGASTDNQGWKFLGVGTSAAFAAWVSGTTYLAGGDFFTGAASIALDAAYAEDGGLCSQLGANTGWRQGHKPFTSSGQVGVIGGVLYGADASNLTALNSGLRAYHPATLADIRFGVNDPTNGQEIFSAAGGTYENTAYLRQIGKDIYHQIGAGGADRSQVWTGVNTTWQMGSGASIGYGVHAVAKLAVGDGTSDFNQARRHLTMTAAPVAGAWARGDIAWNRDPAAAGKVGWVCTTGGTPGTWKAFGVIDA